jgi:hypothetical protein
MMTKNVFIICDKAGDPVVVDKGKGYYKMCWAHTQEDEAKECAKSNRGVVKVVEYTPKGK